jgi:6-pyruvoyltetrahydropterin/6-carboxytetrahydropterin synthase
MTTAVTKNFRFYAAHRNAEVGGKCRNLHGHRYGLSVTVEESRNGSITIHFDDLEAIVEKEIIRQVDHSVLLDVNDPCASALVSSGACEKVFWLRRPTSAENLAEEFFLMLLSSGLNVTALTLQETDTSSVTVTPSQRTERSR